MCKMDYMAAQVKLGGQHALCKMFMTKTNALVANQASQIFGGRAITKTGMGK